MTSPLDQAAAIGSWLAATDIDVLELIGPDGHLRLRRGGEPPVAPGREASGRAVEAASAGASEDVVISPDFGLFLRAHPLHETPLARLGDRVAAGQLLGLLKIGMLLLPVPAPREGVVTAVLAPDGSLVGFGDPLVALSPHA